MVGMRADAKTGRPASCRDGRVWESHEGAEAGVALQRRSRRAEAMSHIEALPMRTSTILPELLSSSFSIDPEAPRLCPIPAKPLGIDDLTSGLSKSLQDAGCPLAHAIQDRLLFKTMLAELSAAFTKVYGAFLQKIAKAS